MSQFSGKCDLCDDIEVCGGFEEFKKREYTIYVGRSETPLKYEKEEDLISYYPHIISCRAGKVIHITEESWVDISEREHLNYILEDILRYYNRCKRKKEEYDPEEAIKQVYFSSNHDAIKELAYRVKEKGKKANIEGIHLEMNDYYRQQLEKYKKEVAERKNVKVYNKLVRDCIPDIIKENGEFPEVDILPEERRKEELWKKLQEEIDELIKDKNEEEIADVLEVLDCLVKDMGFSWDSIKEKKEQKKNKRGSFSKGVFLKSVSDKE